MKKSLTPTPHNAAKYGQIAKRVIMPGDPKRAEWIAKTFLTNAKLVSDVRGVLAFTGKYKNVPVTVMAHGMGIPSIYIYSYELFHFYDTAVIYRVGSCGVTNKSKCKVGDVVVAKYGWSDINGSIWTGVERDKRHIFYPTKESLFNIISTAKKCHIDYHLLPVLSSNFFYNSIDIHEVEKISGCNVLEMESYGLFMCAKGAGKKAACLLTVSDNIETGEAMSAIERQTTFKSMIKLALEAIIKEKI